MLIIIYQDAAYPLDGTVWTVTALLTLESLSWIAEYQSVF